MAEEVSGRKKVNQKCSPCSDDGETIGAAKFCIQCKTALCGECLKKHNALYKKHSVRDLWSEEARAVLALTTEVCHEHLKLVDLYCQQHDKLGCSTCVALDHRSCEQVLYIPKSTKELLQKSDIEGLKEQLAATLKNLESIKIKQEVTHADLEEGRQYCLEEIDVHHIQLQALLNNLVKTSKDQVDHRYETMRADLQRHQENVETCLADLKAAQDRLNNCNDNAAQQFVELKKCQGTLKSKEHIKVDAKENARLKGVDVSIETQLEQLLTDLKTLVTVIEPLRVKNTHYVDVSVEDEQGEDCDTSGTCVLSDGSVLLADYNNKRLKRLDYKSLSINDHCLIEGRPTAVCCINDTEAVVAQDKCLVFVSLQPRLAPTRTLTLTHCCWSVAYFDNELFVTDGEESVYVYDMSGALLRTVTTDDSGQNIFSGTRHVAVSEDREKVYIADNDKGLITIDRHGRVLGTLTHIDVGGTKGVCPDGAGGLFLCGYLSDNVVHMGRRGGVLNEIVSESDELYCPQSVSYDTNNKRLYVSYIPFLLVLELE